MVKNALKRKFSEPQIDMLTSSKPRFYSKKWTKEDIRDAFILKSMSPKSKEWVSKNLVPLPSNTTVWRALNFLHLDVGILKPILVYMRHMRQQTDAHPLDRLCAICFDECSVARIAEYDRILDKVLGKMIGSILHILLQSNFSREGFSHFCKWHRHDPYSYCNSLQILSQLTSLTDPASKLCLALERFT